MNGKFSIEWLYNECMNHRHALSITLNMPIIDTDGTKHYEVIITEILLDECETTDIQSRILYGINTFGGNYPCMGWWGDVVGIHHPTHGISLFIENIMEVRRYH